MQASGNEIHATIIVKFSNKKYILATRNSTVEWYILKIKFLNMLSHQIDKCFAYR